MAAVILAIIAALEAVAIMWLIIRRREERMDYVDLAASHVRIMLQHKRDVAELRETINKQRRNTGKAEM